MGAVFENEHYRVERLPAGIHRMTRKAARFADFDVLKSSNEAMLAELEGEKARALLIDLRRAPSSNSPAFEKVMAPFRARIMTAAPRVAVLLRSAVGKLQIQRLADQDGTPAELFDDERRALAFLEGAPRR